MEDHKKEKSLSSFLNKQPNVQLKLTITGLSMHKNQTDTLHSHIKLLQTLSVYQ